MQCATRTKAACLPITALYILDNNSRPVLLAGQGPNLLIYDLETSGLLLEQRIFDVQTIHHINSTPATIVHPPRIIVAGANHVALCALQLEQQVLRSEFHADAGNWILKAHWHSQGPDTEFFIVLTSHNVLLQLNLAGLRAAQATFKEVASGPKSFLYAGDLHSDGDNKLVIAGGSAFGELVVWKCDLDPLTCIWTATPLYFFGAHNGSVFGVRISAPVVVGRETNYLIASCSDDRQIQIRSVHLDEIIKSLDEVGLGRNTGLGNASISDAWLIATVWGHQSRIWGIDFLRYSESQDPCHFGLSTRGEDATCQQWQLLLHQDTSTRIRTGDLKPIASDHYHAGKNILSFSQHSSSNGVSLVTGGADGRIVVREAASPGLQDQAPLSRRFQDLCPAFGATSLKDYLVIDNEHVLATTNAGDLLLYRATDAKDGEWIRLYVSSGSKVMGISGTNDHPLAVILTTESIAYWSPTLGCVLLETPFSSPGPVAVLQITAASDSLLNVLLQAKGQALVSLLALRVHDRSLKSAESCDLQLPRAFVVTASVYHASHKTLVLGSRFGSLLFYDLSASTNSPVQPFACIDHVHGSDAVTSIQYLPHLDTTGGKEIGYLLTTGRDGTYAIHHVQHSSEYSLKLRTVHRANPPLGPNVEGAVFNSTTQELTVYGFKSTDFVAWSENKQMIIASINCGGAHRSWAFGQEDNTGQGLITWTKASSFNLARTGIKEATVLRNGGHGREIKALAIVPTPLTTKGNEHPPLIATGAEDTEIRLFTTNANGNFRHLAVLRDHTTGPQHLAFSSCGRYLVSSGGCEQLYLWRITRDVPAVEIGIVLQDKMPRTDQDADVRIMDFALFERDDYGDDVSDCHLVIAAAYSNGKVKIIRYKEGDQSVQGTLELLQCIVYGTFCLTQIQVHNKILLTAGTNGYLNIHTLNNHFPDIATETAVHNHKIHQNGVQSLQIHALTSNLHLLATGGDDNALSLTFLLQHDTNANGDDTNPKFRTLSIPKAHAVAVTALQILPLYTSTTERGMKVLVITTGNDQRVKIWKVSIDTPTMAGDYDGIFEDQLLNNVEVEKVGQWWTAVADVSCMEIVKYRSDCEEGTEVENVKEGEEGRQTVVDIDVMIVGVGMEILNLVITT